MKSNGFLVVLMAAHFCGQIQSAEGVHLSNGHTGQPTSLESNTYFNLLCLYEKTQDEHARLLDMKKDLEITNRLEKAVGDLQLSDGHYLKEDSELEQQITAAGLQLEKLRTQIEPFKVEIKKAEATLQEKLAQDREQMAKEKEKMLGGAVKPLVTQWTKRHTSHSDGTFV